MISINIIYINQTEFKLSKSIRVEHFVTNLKKKKEKREEKKKGEKERKKNQKKRNKGTPERLKRISFSSALYPKDIFDLFLSTFRKRSTLRSASQWKRNVVF